MFLVVSPWGRRRAEHCQAWQNVSQQEEGRRRRKRITKKGERRLPKAEREGEAISGSGETRENGQVKETSWLASVDLGHLSRSGCVPRRQHVTINPWAA